MTIDERIYRQLLRLYPRAFRRRFEGEMMALFTERRNAAAPSLRGHLSFYLSVVIDLAKSVVQERWLPTPGRKPGQCRLAVSATTSDRRGGF